MSMREAAKNQVILCLDKFLVHENSQVSGNKRPDAKQTPADSAHETTAPPTKKHKIANDVQTPQATTKPVLLSQLQPEKAQEIIWLQHQALDQYKKVAGQESPIAQVPGESSVVTISPINTPKPH